MMHIRADLDYRSRVAGEDLKATDYTNANLVMIRSPGGTAAAF
jgi:hypothetical protein